MNTKASVLDLLRLIMIDGLGIDSDRVFIYNQKFNIPPKDSLFVAIEDVGVSRTISARNKLEDDGQGGANENQNTNKLESITISLYSRNLDALNMKEYAEMALHSIYAQQLMESNSFKIFRGAAAYSVPAPEGAALLYRFDIDVKVQAWYNRVKTQEFFDSHEVEVLVNDGVPDLDVVFVIPDTDPTVYPQT